MATIYDNQYSSVKAWEKAINEYYSKLQQAYRTGKGDPEELAGLVRDAMGKRSQRAFAQELGVNVSTVSRILDGRIINISDVILARIAACADPESGITLEKLMAAQGMVKASDRGELELKYEEACRRIFADELLKRGYSVTYQIEQQRYASRYLCDFAVVTDALSGCGRWLLEVKMSSGHSMVLPSGIGKTRIWIDSAMAAFYRGEPIGRASLIVDNRSIFEQTKMILSGTAVRDEISVILISVSAGRIIEEFVAPLADGKVPGFVFGVELRSAPGSS